MSANLAVVLIVLASINIISSQFEQPCSGSWVKEGWTGLSSSPAVSPVCKNGVTRMKFIRNMKMKIKFKPTKRTGALGLSACRDEAQNDCYVADIFGIESGRLGYWWRKHSPTEKGEKGWVPGRAEQLEGTRLQQDSRVSQSIWEGQTTYVFYVERSSRGRLEIRLDGGDAGQQNEMVFFLPEEYNKFAVASYISEGKAEVVGASGCGLRHLIRFRPGQEMKLKWSSGGKICALGVSFCTNSEINDCYVLDIYGEINRQLYFWWRKNSAKEKGSTGWIPGRGMWDQLPETLIKGGPGTESNWKALRGKLQTLQDWPADRKPLIIILKRAYDGTLTVRAEGGDPSQNENMTFDLKPALQHGAVDVFDATAEVYIKDGSAAGLTPPSLSVLGPCFNGELFGYLGDTCETSVNLNTILSTLNRDRREVWSLRPGRYHADMTSPSIEIPPGSERLCVSVSGIATQGARLTVDAVHVDGDPTDGVRIGALADDDSNPSEWQYSRLVADLPPTLRSGAINLVISAERQPGSVVLLQSAELCGTLDCGEKTVKGRPFISHGENAAVAEFPWHAGIYKGPERKQICGGTLVRPDIVISAAHCVHDENDKLLDKSTFKVAVGKLYSDFNRTEPFQQISDITAIYVPARYLGSKRDFEHDLAVLAVNFVFTSVVVPICLDWTGRNLPPLKSGEPGLVSGWGLTENKVRSPVLLFGRLPYITFGDCTKVVPPTFVRYITADKFCAGNINGTTVRPGDSGGGLSFLTAGRWYLRGVVSTGVPNQLTYSSFVDINYFIDWIKGIVPTSVSSRNSVVTT